MENSTTPSVISFTYTTEFVAQDLASSEAVHWEVSMRVSGDVFSA